MNRRAPAEDAADPESEAADPQEVATPPAPTPPPPAPPVTDPRAVALAERLATSRTTAEVDRILADAEALMADGGGPGARAVAIEAAYLSSRWQRGATAFRAARAAGDKIGPLLVFYGAVALYESGARAEAAEELEPALPDIATTPFVEEMARKILGSAGAAGAEETDYR